jgi:hypothetical protein
MALLGALALPAWSQEGAPTERTATANDSGAEATDLAAEFVAAWHTLESTKAQAAAFERETEALNRAADRSEDDHATKSLEETDEETQEQLARIVGSANAQAADAVDRSAKEVADRWTDLERTWVALRTELFRQQVSQYEADLQRNEASQWASLLSVDNRWLWLGGLLAVGAVTAVLLHYRRHELRRQFHGSRARGLGLTRVLFGVVAVLAVVTIGLFVAGNWIYELLLTATGAGTPPAAAVRSDIDRLTSELEASQAQLEKAKSDHETALKAWQRNAGDLGKDAARAFVSLRDLRVALSVEQQFAAALAQDREALEAVKAAVQNTQSQVQNYAFKRQLIAGCLGLGLFGVAGTFGGLFARSVRRHKKEMRSTCPRCLQRGTFEGADEAVGNGKVEPNLICRHQVSDMPYEECEFTFPIAYRDLDKLCFPCLGARAAGKTHWLLTAYRDLNRGAYDSDCQFQRLRNRASEIFDRFVEETLRQRFSTAATQPDLPHPLVFNFLDRDRMGPSNVLINILDFYGEVLKLDNDDLRLRRALQADGYFFLLDPTDTIERQQETLDEFRDRARSVRRLSVGRKLQTPVALCLTKLDMLLSQPYTAGGGDELVLRFYRELGDIGWGIDVESMEARSRLVSKVKDVIWPGWQIERQIRELFGERYLFFPMTPVGLNGIESLAADELMDLSRRVIQPVGLVDPLLWLIHMNGYPVLK